MPSRLRNTPVSLSRYGPDHPGPRQLARVPRTASASTGSGARPEFRERPVVPVAGLARRLRSVHGRFIAAASFGRVSTATSSSVCARSHVEPGSARYRPRLSGSCASGNTSALTPPATHIPRTITQAPGNRSPLHHLRANDVRGAAQLPTQATAGVMQGIDFSNGVDSGLRGRVKCLVEKHRQVML